MSPCDFAQGDIHMQGDLVITSLTVKSIHN
jgi:hypothetical protein